MTSTSSAATPLAWHRAQSLRGWRPIVGIAALGAGILTVAGSFLPWAEIFAGLIGVPGVRGANGKVLAFAGGVIAAAALWHLVRGSSWTRWVIGIGGAAVLGYSSYLLLELSASLRSLGTDSMVAARGGPGLWLVAAGGLAAFGTLFLPSSGQTAFLATTSDGRSLRAWAADRTSAGPRRRLQLGLGVIWLVDAGLQFQPYMFTAKFATHIIEPVAMGSPALIANSVMGTGQLLLAHPVIFNAIFATIQLALGAGLIWRRTARAALAGSVIWGLAVWWLGEGLGGLLTGTATPLTGAPGGALLYVIIAVLAWPSRDTADDTAPTVAARSPIGRLGASALWIVFWGSAVYLALQSANLTPRSLTAAITGQSAGEPGWIAAMNRGIATAIGTNGAGVTLGFAVLFAVIAVGYFVPRATRVVIVAAMITAVAIWIFGEDFGGVLTGRGTDPNTGPLIVLLAVAYWPRRPLRAVVAREDRQPELSGGVPRPVPETQAA
jgi:hypothetical protein